MIGYCEILGLWACALWGMEEALLEGMEEERATPPDIYLVMISILLSSSFTFWLVDFITVGFFKKDCCSVIISDL